MLKKSEILLEQIKNKKITLMGIGGFKTGSGMGAAKFLIGRAKEVIITDIKDKNGLHAQIKAMGGIPEKNRITFHLGGHRKKDFINTDMVVRNPGVPYYSEFLKAARRARVPIENDVTLFLKLHGLKNIVGVTGTRGKTTTAHLIYNILVKHLALSSKKAFLAGNIGFSPLLKPSWQNPEMPGVFELSSFMLHEFGEQKISPHIAVVTNFYPDHLNKYKNLKDYAADKQNIYLHQKKGDIAIFNWHDKEARDWGENELRRRGNRGKKEIKFFSLDDLKPYAEDLKEWNLPGAHNLINLAGAVAASKAFGVSEKSIRGVIRNFKGVPHRLELVKISKGGVKWYNDSAATSPEGAIAALDSFPARKIILISGGNSKGLDLKKFSAKIKNKVRVLIKVNGNATRFLPSRFTNHFSAGESRTNIFNIRGKLEDAGKNGALRQAVKIATKEAAQGDAVLFSPGLTWLPSINEFARGDIFRKLVKKLVR